MAATTNSGVPIKDIDGVPDYKLAGDLLVGLIVGALKGGESTVGEDHAPSIGDVGGVALNDSDVMVGVGFFDEQGAIEARGTATEDEDVHGSNLPIAIGYPDRKS